MDESPGLPDAMCVTGSLPYPPGSLQSRPQVCYQGGHDYPEAIQYFYNRLYYNKYCQMLSFSMVAPNVSSLSLQCGQWA